MTTTNPSPDEITELLSNLNRIIIEREKNNDQNPTAGVDPAVLQQLQAVSSHMKTMNDRLERAVWQMDNGFDGVHGRMDGLSCRLDSIESGLKILLSRSGEQASESPGDAVEEHDSRARLQNRRIGSGDKLASLHNRSIENPIPDTSGL